MRRPARQEKFLAQPLRACSVGGTLLTLVAVTAVLIPMEPLGIDLRWSHAMRAIATTPLKDLALVFDALGGIGSVAVYIAVGLILAFARRWLPLVCFAITELATSLSASLLKAAVGRPRPPDALIHPLGSSFPSGHAAHGGATFVALVLAFTAVGPRRRWWWALAAVGIVVMAWSRTYLHVHWLSDVTGGSMLGIGIALVVFGGAQWFLARRMP